MSTKTQTSQQKNYNEHVCLCFHNIYRETMSKNDNNIRAYENLSANRYQLRNELNLNTLVQHRVLGIKDFVRRMKE